MEPGGERRSATALAEQKARRLALRYLGSNDPRLENQFIHENEWLAALLVREFPSESPPDCRDEMMQEARLGLLDALRNFDPLRGSIYGLVRRCIRNRLGSFLRSRSRSDRLVDLERLSPDGLRSERETISQEMPGATELASGLMFGQMFRWSVLLAPISRSRRFWVLRHFRGERQGTGHYNISRARDTWKDLVWADCMADSDAIFGGPHERSLRGQIRSSDSVIRENAAFAIWVIRALPQVWKRALHIDLDGLIKDVIDQARLTADPMLRRVAINLAYGLDPNLLMANRASLEGPTAYVNIHSFQSLPGFADRTLASLCAASEYMHDGPASIADLHGIWNLSASLGQAANRVPGLTEAIAADGRLASNSPFLAASSIAHYDLTAGLDLFLRASRMRNGRRGNTLETITGALQNRSDRAGAVLMRRTAALVLRTLEPRDRVRIAMMSMLNEDQPFVRLTLMGSLRQALQTGGAESYPSLLPALVEVFGRSFAARGSTKPSELLHGILQTLVIADPIGAEATCVRVLSGTDHELRGHALYYLGMIWQRQLGISGNAIEERLLSVLRSHREYCINVAQALFSALPVTSKSLDGEEIRINPGFVVPLWRTSWP